MGLVFVGPDVGADDDPNAGPTENSDVGVDTGGADSDFNGDTPDPAGPDDPDQGDGDNSQPATPPPPPTDDQSGQQVRARACLKGKEYWSTPLRPPLLRCSKNVSLLPEF